jgi:hypothetical protein
LGLASTSIVNKVLVFNCFLLKKKSEDLSTFGLPLVGLVSYILVGLKLNIVKINISET